MLSERIIGAFTFRKGVYADVENDASFTSMAWIIVAVVSLLNSLGSFAFGEGWLLSTLIGTVMSVIFFGAACFVVAWVGKAFFKADVTFEEMVRTLGLAYVWRIIGVLGILGGVISCILAPALIVAAILGLVAWFVAAKEALDLEWGQTIVTVIIGWILVFIGTVITGVFLGLLGIGAASVWSAFGF